MRAPRQARGKMQAVTDAAALNAAREFQMVQANVEKVSTVARNYASQIQGAAVDVAVDIDRTHDSRHDGQGRAEPVRPARLGQHHACQDQRHREDDQRAAAVPARARAEGERRDQAGEECAADRAGMRGQLQFDELERPGLAGRRGAAGRPDLLGRRQGEDQEHQLHARAEDRLSGDAGSAGGPPGAGAVQRHLQFHRQGRERRHRMPAARRLLRRPDRHERRDRDAQPGHLHLPRRSAHSSTAAPASRATACRST